MIEIGVYHPEIVIEIIIVDRSSGSPGPGRKSRRRRSAASSGHDLKRRRVISTKKLNEWLKEM